MAWKTLTCPSCRGNFLLRTDPPGPGPCPRCGKPLPAPDPEPEPDPAAPEPEANGELLEPLEDEAASPPPEPDPLEGVFLEPLDAEGPEPELPRELPPEPVGPVYPEPADPDGLALLVPVLELDAGPAPEEPPAPPPAPVVQAVACPPPEDGSPLVVALPVEPEPPPALSRPEPAPAAAPPELDPLTMAADEPEPPRPGWLLWLGVFTFPWHPRTLGVWLVRSLGLAVVAFLAAVNCFLFRTLDETGLIGQQYLLGATVSFITGLAFFAVWALPYVASDLLAVIRDTAAGSPDVDWSNDSLIDRLVRLVYLLWVCLWLALPLVPLAVALRPLLDEGWWGWLLLFLPGAVLFPVLFLGALANNTPWLPVNLRVLGCLLRRPHLGALAVLAGTALLFPCGWLSWYAVNELEYALAPAVGAAWAAALLIYGRLLGRIAWAATRDDGPARARAPRRKKRQGGAPPPEAPV